MFYLCGPNVFHENMSSFAKPYDNIIITEKMQFCGYHVVLTWHQCILHQNSIVQNTPTHAFDLCIGTLVCLKWNLGGVSGQELTSVASEVVLASFSHTQQPWQGPYTAL